MAEETPRDRLKYVIRIQDWSVRRLASLTGVSKSGLHAYLAGDTGDMEFLSFAAIAKVTKISLDWLAGLPEREKEPLAPDEQELLRLWRGVRSDLMRDTTLGTLRTAIALEDMQASR